MDLNHGRLPPTDLQSVAIDHAAIPPLYVINLLVTYWSRQGDSNLRPADYKSAALPTELHRLQQASILQGFSDSVKFRTLLPVCWVRQILR